MTNLDNIRSNSGRSGGDESLRDGGGEAGGESSVQLPGVGQGLAGNNHAVELKIFQSDLLCCDKQPARLHCNSTLTTATKNYPKIEIFSLE